jgi:hypothetical protein
MSITWDSKIPLSPQEVSRVLRSGQPSIVIGGGEGRPGLAMNTFMLQPGEEQVIAEQLSKVLREHSS